MQFRKVNNITGWVICAIACIVYIMTMEATGSLWDCGEFISAAYKVQIPHPPGAPLFVMLGRLFTLFFPNNPARGVNLMSALASGFTILFLFWSITHFGRKVYKKAEDQLTFSEIFTIMTAGAVGALAYTFSDSFWYSAVEGEVYAMSSFFTAIVFWAVLKWEHQADQPGADKWIILIFYLMGLSIGVHLLNLLTIPAIVMIYYFRRYKVSNWGIFWAFVIGCIITGVVQKAVIQYTVSWAGLLDITFVNDFGLPFFSGFTTFFVLLTVLIFFALRYANRKGYRLLRVSIWSFAFMLVGYSTYVTTMIRSNANPAVDMYNVDNPISLTGYLGRDQYGDFPLVKGQNFTATPHYVNDGDQYGRGTDKYEIVGKKMHAEFDEADQMVFPRVWDNSNEQNHGIFYAQWLGIGVQQDAQGQVQYERPPTFGENLSFFVSYQVNWMYLRYFMWNFAGKQNDIQGYGNVRDGNWITGIGPWDNVRLGDQGTMPDSVRTKNKAYNRLFALPLILGLFGFFFQLNRRRNDFLIVGLLFFFTGFAIVVYLNQAGNQPRERDYAYVGSFYAFAMWIGLGVFLVKEWLDKVKGFTGAVANYATAAVCLLAVPVLMASQEWDDHDRSQKVMALDLAKDYLESCAPNAILFTFGDNDTYPLWFAQEVGHVRPDIRVVNTSLLGIDWYINQLRYKVNQSAPIDPIWSADAIAGDKRNVVYNQSYVNRNAKPETTYTDLYTVMKDAGSDAPGHSIQTQDGDMLSIFMARKVSLPVDADLVRRNGTVTPNDTVVSEVQFEIPKSVLYKNDAAILGIIAANKWQRPIYFTAPYGSLGFGSFLRQDGLSYRLVPVLNKGRVNEDWMMDKAMNVFGTGGAAVKGTYFDEENRRHLLTIRQAYTNLAISLNKSNRREDSKKALNKVDKGMDPDNMPYGMASRYGNDHNETSFRMALAAYDAGDLVLGRRIAAAIKKDCEQQMRYYEGLDESRKGGSLQYEYDTAKELLGGLAQLERQFAGGNKSAEGGSTIVNSIDSSPKK